jgi:hypothetical protein
MIARAPQFTQRRTERKVGAVRDRDSLGDLRITESDIDVPDFLK